MTNAPSGRVGALVNNKLSRGFPIVGDSPSSDWFHCSPDVRGGGSGAPWDEPAQFDRAINVDVGQTGGRYHSVDGGQMVGSHHQWL